MALMVAEKVEKLDEEWVQIIKRVQEAGIEKEEIFNFIKEKEMTLYVEAMKEYLDR